MIKWIVATLIGALLGFGIYLFWYLGGYKSVEITSRTEGPLKLIFKIHVGPYHKIAPKIEEVEQWAKENGIDCSRSFGEYFDDPEKVEEDRLRSRGGCVVSELPKEIPAEFGWVDYPSRLYVTAQFEGAPSIGPMKVYPKAEHYIYEHKFIRTGPVLEIYQVHSHSSMTTTYLFPVSEKR